MPNLGQLRSRAQRKADMENDDGIGTPEWNDYLNEAEDAVYDELISLWYFVANPQSLIGAGSSAFALAGDYYETLYVHRADGAYYQPLDPIHNHNLAEFRYAGAPFATHYHIEGAQIVLYPTPPVGQVYEHRYAPIRTPLAGDGDNSVIPARWSEGTVLLAAIAGRSKDESTSVTDLQRQYAKFEARLKAAKLKRVLEATRAPLVRTPSMDSYFRRPYTRFW